MQDSYPSHYTSHIEGLIINRWEQDGSKILFSTSDQVLDSVSVRPVIWKLSQG
jgi:hypothetical protein